VGRASAAWNGLCPTTGELIEASTMPLVRTIVVGLLGRHTARRLARLIPNPVLRAAAVAVATTLLPIMVEKVANRRKARRIR
jgi:hypothetical protein